MERRYIGDVSATARLSLRDPAALKSDLHDFRGQTVVLTLEKLRDVHSARQGRYYWRCVVQTFQDIWSAPRIHAGLDPYTKDETHDVLVQVLYPTEPGPLGSRLRKRTAPMDTAEFALHIDRCRELALLQYGSTIPTPGEAEAT